MRFIPKEGVTVVTPTGGTVPPEGIDTDAETLTHYARRANDGEGQMVESSATVETETVTEPKRGK